MINDLRRLRGAGSGMSTMRSIRPVAASSLRSIAVPVLLALAAGASAQAYKWTDPSGRPVFGDNPPRDARNLQQVGGTGPADGPQDALSYEYRRLVERYPVTLYTTEGCSACDSGRALLTGRGIPFDERRISTNADRDAFTKLSIGEQVPVLQVGSQQARGFETGAWSTLLDAAGFPKENRLPRNYQQPPARPLAPPAAPAPGGEPQAGGAPAAAR
jgi:glutaredoxin